MACDQRHWGGSHVTSLRTPHGRSISRESPCTAESGLSCCASHTGIPINSMANRAFKGGRHVPRDRCPTGSRKWGHAHFLGMSGHIQQPLPRKYGPPCQYSVVADGSWCPRGHGSRTHTASTHGRGLVNFRGFWERHLLLQVPAAPTPVCAP